MSYTIKDVAKEANVSIATVSRVINGKDKVKKETREKIQRAIAKLHYVPDQVARTMINKKTKTIGMFVPLLSNEYWAQLAEAIQRKLMVKGYTLIISTYNYEQESVHSYLNTFLERKVDGLIIASRLDVDVEQDEKYLGLFVEQGIPLVSFNTYKNITSVSGDSISSSMEAVEHLIRLGHRKIAFIGTVSCSIDRELGYRNAVMLNGLEIDESIIIGGRHEYVHYFSEYGYRCALQLLSDNKPFSAVFCANDLIAIGVIKAFEDKGILVPSDKAVIGFDDINIAHLYRPALTTIKQPIDDMAGAAIDILLEQIDKPEVPRIQKKITFPMELIIRESCGSKKRD
jgi:LacI family transcriptional regulator